VNVYHTFCIDRRTDGTETILDGKWRFGWFDESTDDPMSLTLECEATLPGSVYSNLCEAGVLPDPYIGVNSRLYHWIDKKIWYFAREFELTGYEGKDVYLCFDGCGYRSRVWLNGELLCAHEGMFGGPIVNIAGQVREHNELIVELTPPCARDNPGHAAEIVPWNIVRDKGCSNGDFIQFGIWRSVRIETVPTTHISRPYLYTISADAEKACLRLEVELADEQVKELEVPSCDITKNYGYCWAYDAGVEAVPTDRRLNLAVSLAEKDTGKTVYHSREIVEILDKSRVTRRDRYRECQFIECGIELENPRLWWPNGLGDPNLYTATLALFEEEGNNPLDILSFDTGIRTVERKRTAGPRLRTRWDKFLFSVNGRDMFIRGMNWMPIDFMFDSSDEDYRWALELAKHAGIQMLRVWSGGGMPEDDRFYSLCDELGIMVMQDNFIANQSTPEWNREVLSAQVCRNLYRIRNHPSLVIHNGGNEFNPYELGNDASMWVIARETADLDHSREFMRTSPDKGSTHVYRDMEPVWYRKIYSALPLLAESGIHAFPNFKSLRQQISEKECRGQLTTIFSEEFKISNPELHNHFTEFIPSRIPRMMSRASIIDNVREMDLERMCEATQISAYEFYQIMLQSLRENYPVAGGILPWVFKRQWTTVAIQLIDGLGDTTAMYYATKNSYSPLVAEIALREVTFAPGESFTPDLRLLCSIGEPKKIRAGYELWSPSLELLRRETFDTEVTAGEGSISFDAAPVDIPEEWSDRFFFLRAFAADESGELQQSFYWCKALECMRDTEFAAKRRADACENIDFVNGPWLKPQVTAIGGAGLRLRTFSSRTYRSGTERRARIAFEIENTGSKPAFPVTLGIEEFKTLSMFDDNFFFLGAGKSRRLEAEVRIKDDSLTALTLTAYCWNCGETIKTEITL